VRPLHIAFFNRSYYPDTTATGQLLTELCEALVKSHGCRVSVVAGASLVPSVAGQSVRSSGILFRRERHNGVAILRARGTRFSKRRFIGRFSNYVTYFLSACYAGLRLDRPDVVVALTDPPIVGLAAYLASLRFRIPFVMSYRDIFPEVAVLLEDFHSPTVNWVLQQVNRFLVLRAVRSVALGATMRRRLIDGKGADPTRVVIIPDWADCFEITPGPKANPFSEAQGLADKFIVMHSGNIGLSQNLATVVEAASHLKQYPDLQFVFVGEGVTKPRLQQKAQDLELTNVRFLPYTPKAQLTQSFAAADVFVVSLLPGLAGYIVPSKLYGILAAGRPCVAAVEPESEVVGITQKYGCGLLAEPGNATDLAAKILTLYRDRALAVRMGVNARMAALNFDRKLLVGEYNKLFRELAPSFARHGIRTAIKRGFDILLSGLGLLLSGPLWALIAILVKLGDGGPVFFPQERMGKGGKLFRSWKFRSMTPDADQRFGPLQAKEDDPRVTRVGRVLRVTAMDELPQLWNIFRGDMSFVGPRALMPEEIEVNADGERVLLEAIPGFEERHQVSPGLTGIAQVFAPRDITRKNKFRFDRLYIQRQSFCLDLKLIILSFWITFRGKWESRLNKV
jgi:colanic acid biosynthesis glycosyl transferase WcaI